MKAETPSFEAHQFVRVRRGDAVRRLIQRDKTPLAVLFMAAVVGTLAGLVGVAFEKSVNWVQNQRIGALAQVAGPLVSGLAAGVYPVGAAGDGRLFSGASLCAGGRRLRDSGN